MPIRVLALDLERTLVSDARHADPRPGLATFLAFCQEQFPRVVLFTTVQEADARAVINELAERGYLPAELAERLEYVSWCGEYKDLAFVPDAAPEECSWSMTTRVGFARTSEVSGSRSRRGTAAPTTSCFAHNTS